jgi:uncharacterized protein YqeY
MAEANLKIRIQDDVKAAMRAGEKARLATLRLITAALKQVEVDSRKELGDTDVIAILDKMCKQRRESIEQFSKADRTDLIEKENAELSVISEYLPQPLSEDEITALINDAIAESGANSMKDMGKVMGIIKHKAQGRADMGKLSAQIKARLG